MGTDNELGHKLTSTYADDMLEESAVESIVLLGLVLQFKLGCA